LRRPYHTHHDFKNQLNLKHNSKQYLTPSHSRGWVAVITRKSNIIMLKSEPRVLGSNVISLPNWLFSNKKKSCRIDGIGKIYDFWHQMIELDENHRFHISKSWNLRFRSLSEWAVFVKKSKFEKQTDSFS
jgi:hypothetical protein